MMNCLDFRRICLSDPRERSDPYLAHRSQCRECRRFAESVDALDGKLRAAMQVPIPGDLATRIKLRQVIGDEKIRRRTRPWQLALAASVFVMIGLGGLFGYRLYSTQRYVDQLRVAVLDHVKQEPQFLAASGEVSPEQFKRVMAAFGGNVIGEVAPIRRAEVCALKDNKQPIAHAVVQGQSGAVTILYLTGKRVSSETPLRDERFRGVLVPAGDGNLAVVGQPDEPLDSMVERLQESIVWRI